MTDDTLKVECETLLDSLEATYSDVALYGGALAEVHTKYKADIAKLLAFARAQQAKALGDVQGRLCMVEKYLKSGRYSQASDIIANTNMAIAQATAREQGHVPYPGWCRQADQCQGKSSCPLDPTCAD